MARPPLDLEAMAAGVRARTPAWVARAITLVESTRADHQDEAQKLLAMLTPDAAAVWLDPRLRGAGA